MFSSEGGGVVYGSWSLPLLLLFSSLFLSLSSSLSFLFLLFLNKAGEEEGEEEVPYPCRRRGRRREKGNNKERGGEDKRRKKHGNEKAKDGVNNGQERGKDRIWHDARAFFLLILLSLAYSRGLKSNQNSRRFSIYEVFRPESTNSLLPNCCSIILTYSGRQRQLMVMNSTAGLTRSKGNGDSGSAAKQLEFWIINNIVLRVL